jgi:hypothetical protein
MPVTGRLTGRRDIWKFVQELLYITQFSDSEVTRWQVSCQRGSRLLENVGIFLPGTQLYILEQCFSTAGPRPGIIIPGPRLIEKRTYRAAVWQRLRTTVLEDGNVQELLCRNFYFCALYCNRLLRCVTLGCLWTFVCSYLRVCRSSMLGMSSLALDCVSLAPQRSTVLTRKCMRIGRPVAGNLPRINMNLYVWQGWVVNCVSIKNLYLVPAIYGDIRVLLLPAFNFSKNLTGFDVPIP